METVNFTIEIPASELIDFENWLRDTYRCLDLRILPNTKELYDNDEHFRKLDKQYRKARRLKDEYINKKL